MTLRAVLIATLASHLMVSITRPLLGLFASSLGAGTFVIGLLAACHALLAVQLGRCLQRRGPGLAHQLGGREIQCEAWWLRRGPRLSPAGETMKNIHR